LAELHFAFFLTNTINLSILTIITISYTTDYTFIIALAMFMPALVCLKKCYVFFTNVNVIRNSTSKF